MNRETKQFIIEEIKRLTIKIERNLKAQIEADNNGVTELLAVEIAVAEKSILHLQTMLVTDEI